MQKIIIGLILALILGSCQEGPQEDMGEIPVNNSAEPAMMARDAIMARAESGFELNSPEGINDTKIIKTGNIGLLVDDIENSRNQVDELLEKYQGYYANESFNDFDHESVYNLTARLPAASFESFIKGVEECGDRVVSKNISARDVTEEYIDLEMRLNNRRSYLDRYNDLLQQARSVADILEIQEKTRILEEEIESVEGRLKYLEGQVGYSTLHITLKKEKEFRFRPEKRDSFLERLKQSFSGGWHGFISIILFLFRIWPLWIAVVATALILRRYRMRS